MLEAILFYVAATGTLLGAVGVLFARNPLRSALSLIVSLCSAAMLYVLLEASFVAAMQILVYAGAILVLFIFLIMLLNLGGDEGKPVYPSISRMVGGAAIGYLAFRLGSAVFSASGTSVATGVVDGSVKSIGRILLTDYLFAFEAVSVLLLTAVVGAVVLSLKRLT